MSEAGEPSLEALVVGCNELARAFYSIEGYVVGDDFKFYLAHHPHELRVWGASQTRLRAYSKHRDGRRRGRIFGRRRRWRAQLAAKTTV